MKNVIKKYKLAINVIGYLFMIGAITFFVIKPALGSIKENKDNIQKLILDQEIKEKRIAEIPELEGAYEEVAKQSERINYFFTEDKAVELIEGIEDLARDTGNTVIIEVLENKEDKVTRGTNTENTKEAEANIMDDLPMKDFIHLKINLGGSYDSLVNFITKLEAMKYYSNVVALNSVNEVKTKAVEGAVKEKPDALTTEVAPTATENVLNSSIEIVFYVKK